MRFAGTGQRRSCFPVVDLDAYKNLEEFTA
jgi:hypothetical protein